METKKLTFWDLIRSYTVTIPIIQRDYAQGRVEEAEKRDKFLNAIYKHLAAKTPLDLDFIYGKCEGDTFFPIDGQQRLTTLFLIHWYVSTKEKVGDTERNHLAKFVYDTRISSREFCQVLISAQPAIPADGENNDLVLEIQNYHWFRDSWKSDPTIQGMLTMIRAIHDKFNAISSLELWERLTKRGAISFHVLDLGEKKFNLADELYIKMNARGKQLSPFENFKANFIQFLENSYKEEKHKLPHPIKVGRISYADYFSYKIEKEWTDLFWAFRGDKTVIDEMFMQFFGYVSEMCYFRSRRNAMSDDFKGSFEQHVEIFKDEGNLKFLFASLDLFHTLALDRTVVQRPRIQAFFNSLFDNAAGGHGLFWNLPTTGGPDLFAAALGCNDTCTGYKPGSRQLLEVRDKIILYCLIYFLLKHNLRAVNDELRRYIRVVRNLLQSIRQREETSYTANARINYFGSYCTLLERLAEGNVYAELEKADTTGTRISAISLNREKIKGRIISQQPTITSTVLGAEALPCFSGMIHLLKPETNTPILGQWTQAAREIWDASVSDIARIQALIACGFAGVYVKDSRMGQLRFFGKKGSWDSVLTCTDGEPMEGEISACLISLLTKYLQKGSGTVQEKLESIVNDWRITHPDDRSWRHYFIKYPEFIFEYHYYAWKNDWEIRILRSKSSNPLTAYHISPYVLAVCGRVKNEKICAESDCWQRYTGNYPLVLKTGVSLTCTNNGWVINAGNTALSQETSTRFNLPQQGGGHLLKETKNRDMVEIAVDFVRAISN